MLTIKVIDNNRNHYLRSGEKISVQIKLDSDLVDRGNKALFIESENLGCEAFESGKVWIMNETGSTVAHYNLTPNV